MRPILPPTMTWGLPDTRGSPSTTTGERGSFWQDAVNESLTNMYQNDTRLGVTKILPFSRPINWDKLRTDEAERIVRLRAKVTKQVEIREHAWERSSERDLPRPVVFDILRTGLCHDQPKRNEYGKWQVIITKRLSGNREAGVVTVILESEERLIVRTVEWMDLR